jgi:soluble lytic murein transglycosylase-like protein
MATFPSVADVQRRTPNVEPSVASYRTVQAAPIGTEEAQTLYEQGRQTQQAAQSVDQLGKQLDETAAQDALNQLRQARQDLTYDPEKGFRRFKGGDVLKPGPGGQPLLDELPAGLQKQADAIGGKLVSPRARQLFQTAAAKEGIGFKHDLAVYMAGQSEEFEGATYKNTQTGTLNEVAQAADDPAKVMGLAVRAERAALKRAAQLGLPGDALAAAARSNVFRTAIEIQLANGNNRGALQMFDRVASSLDGNDRVQLTARLKSAATDLDADNVAQSYLGLQVPQAVRQYDPLIKKAAGDTGIPEALGYGLISQESGGNPNAVSSAGASGLTQLMPGTAKDLGVTNPLDPQQAVPGGFRYLKQQLVKYDGNERLALMAYNWGPGNVDNWLKKGANPDAIPAETREYVSRVQGYAASFGGKADVKTAQLDLLNRTDLPTAVKAAAYAKIEKQSAAMEALRTATTKQLDGQAQAVITSAILDPSSYKDGTLQTFADNYAAIGDAAKAARFRVLAAMESTLKTFATSASDAQRAMIEQVLEGLPKQVAQGLISGDNKARTEARARGNEAFDVLKKAFTDNVAPEGLQKQARMAIEAFNSGGDSEGARKVAQFYENAAQTNSALQQDRTATDRTITDLKVAADSGQATAQQLQLYDLMTSAVQRQQAAFNADPYKAGTDLYANVGKAVPMNWGDTPDNVSATLAIKAQQARQISALRGGIDVLPFSGAEISELRNALDAGAPDQQRRIMTTLSSLPPEMVPKVAAALAGKGNAGDPLSRSYAAAMSFYADRAPDQAVVADQILRGAQLIKEAGASGRKPATTSDAWQQALQDRVGNVFADMGAKVPAVVADAVAAHYVYQMNRAGRQGEKTDPEILDKSITAVMGQSILHNGQALLPPVRGMTRYEFDGLLGRLTNGDTDGLRTTEGDPITADLIRRRGVLTNVADGVYKVRVPDPRRNGDLSEVVNPQTGSAWLLDAKGLLQRSAPLGSRDPNAPDYIRAPSLSGR